MRMTAELHKNAHVTRFIVNDAAGTGTSPAKAAELAQKTGIEIVSFLDLIGQPKTALQEKVLSEVENLFIFGGDGTTFALMRWLAEHHPELPKLVIPLGLGGENVVAKQLHTHTNQLETIGAVLAGEYTRKTVSPSAIRLDSALTQPFFWNVHAGYSGLVLQKIEEQRQQGVSDKTRRYSAPFAVLKNMAALEPITVTLEKPDRTEHLSGVDAGVITREIPFWTSKVHLPIPAEAHAVLHLIAHPSQTDRYRFEYYVRLLLETLALSSGIPTTKELITHTPLLPGTIVTFEQTHPNFVAVDSEVSTAQTARISFPSENIAESAPAFWLADRS